MRAARRPTAHGPRAAARRGDRPRQPRPGARASTATRSCIGRRAAAGCRGASTPLARRPRRRARRRRGRRTRTDRYPYLADEIVAAARAHRRRARRSSACASAPSCSPTRSARACDKGRRKEVGWLDASSRRRPARTRPCGTSPACPSVQWHGDTFDLPERRRRGSRHRRAVREPGVRDRRLAARRAVPPRGHRRDARGLGARLGRRAARVRARRRERLRADRARYGPRRCRRHPLRCSASTSELEARRAAGASTRRSSAGDGAALDRRPRRCASAALRASKKSSSRRRIPRPRTPAKTSTRWLSRRSRSTS